MLEWDCHITNEHRTRAVLRFRADLVPHLSSFVFRRIKMGCEHRHDWSSYYCSHKWWIFALPCPQQWNQLLLIRGYSEPQQRVRVTAKEALHFSVPTAINQRRRLQQGGTKMWGRSIGKSASYATLSRRIVRNKNPLAWDGSIITHVYCKFNDKWMFYCILCKYDIF